MQPAEVEPGRPERRRVTERAWIDFIQDGLEPAEVRAPILRSWHRTHDAHRIDPGMLCPKRVLSGEALAEKLRSEDALLLSAPLLQEVARQLSDHVLAYFDKDGWLLAIGGDPGIIRRLEDIHFRPGVDWSEAAAGTNGPGTCLAEGVPLLVEGAEHYVASWQSWSCSAVPLFLPGAPTPFGAIDVTGPWNLHSRRAGALVHAVALAIGERLHAAIRTRDEVVRYALRAACEGGDALVAVDLGGRVLGLNDAATRRRLVDPTGLAPALREALKIGKTAAALASEGEARIAVHDGPALIVSAVSYEGRPVGAIIRAAAARPAPAQRASQAKVRCEVGCDFGHIIGQSDALCRAIELARTAARNTLPVVVSGETGTGKEMFARSIHAASSRASERLVVMNCGAVPATLIEAELFGYEAGAFTGARPGGSPGRFEDADHGTLFLDEIAELPEESQVALLRVLQEGEVRPIGAGEVVPVDVRVVAATHQDLAHRIADGRFRQDLYARLAGFEVALVPLRDRREDIGSLVAALLPRITEDASGVTVHRQAARALLGYGYPLNVRELEQALRAAVVLAGGGEIRIEHLPEAMRGVTAPAATVLRPEDRALRERLIEVLREARGNVAAAGRQMNKAPIQIRRWCRRFGIELGGFRG